MRSLLIASAISLSLITVTPIFASTSAKDESPVDRQICKKIEVVGSRLRTKKVCMTAAEWSAQRAEDRMNVERNQNIRTKNNSSI